MFVVFVYTICCCLVTTTVVVVTIIALDRCQKRVGGLLLIY